VRTEMGVSLLARKSAPGKRWTSAGATPAQELVRSTPGSRADTSSFDVLNRGALS
jgi:hypothetical protein